MRLKLFKLVLAAGLFYGHISAQTNDDTFSVTWNIDNVESIANNPTTTLGEPTVIETPQGDAIRFDGIDDGLIVKANPLENATTAFTIEVIFRPDSSWPNNQEQRFVHIQNPNDNDRRILIETRLTADHHWFLDTFIKSELSATTLFAEDFPHSLSAWHHAALVYDNGVMRHYVDGVPEMSDAVNFLLITGGHTSLGVRMNKKHWFKGAIRTLRVTHRVLSPEEFLDHDTVVKERKIVLANCRVWPNVPNPFNPTTSFRFEIPAGSRVKVDIMNVQGRKVVTLADKNFAAGFHVLHWNGTDQDNQPVASGTYFYHVSSDDRRVSGKMLLMR